MHSAPPVPSCAWTAGQNPTCRSPDAHASHDIERGAGLPVVQSTLGHSNIAVTSGYLYAPPGTWSGLGPYSRVFRR
jgi:hypothetical protein